MSPSKGPAPWEPRPWERPTDTPYPGFESGSRRAARLRRLEEPEPAERTPRSGFVWPWLAGVGAVVLVVALTILSGPDGLSFRRRLFVWFSTAIFSVWILRTQRHRAPRALRVLMFLVCFSALMVLTVVLTVSAI
jgi:hypothetical protein